jgi:hypothetical protein
MKASPDSFVGDSLEFLEFLRKGGAKLSDIILSDDILSFSISGDIAKVLSTLEATTPSGSSKDEEAAS